MFEINAGLLYFILIVGWLIFRLSRAARHGRPPFWRELSANLLFAYLCFLMWQTFSPFYFSWFSSTRSVNLVPLAGIFGMIRTAQELGDLATARQVGINLLGNVAIFMPLGFLAALLFPTTRRFGRMAGVGLLTSLSIELAQFFLAVRVSDVDDLLLNVLGTLLGLGLFALLTLPPPFRRYLKRLDAAARPQPAGAVVGFGVFVVLVFAVLFFWQGWRVTLAEATLKQEMQANGYPVQADARFQHTRALLVEAPQAGQQVMVFAPVLPGRLVPAYTWSMAGANPDSGFTASLFDAGQDGLLSLVVTHGTPELISLELEGESYRGDCAGDICLFLTDAVSLQTDMPEDLTFRDAAGEEQLVDQTH